MDYNDAKRIEGTINTEALGLARNVAANVRKLSASKIAYKQILNKELPRIREDNPRMAIETVKTILNATNEAANNFDDQIIFLEGEISADKEVREELRDQRSYAQSLMKFEKENS